VPSTIPFGTTYRRVARPLVLALKGVRVLLREGPVMLVGRMGDWRRGGPAAREPTARWFRVNGEVRASPSVLAVEEIQSTQEATGEIPEVSVVVVAFNALRYLRACLDSVMAAETQRAFEVVVVDNGSRMDMLEWLRGFARRHDNVSVVRAGENLGFARGANLGVSKARGRFLVLLNSDTLVTSGWLDRLVDVLVVEPTIGIVSPVTNYVGEGPQIDEAARSLEPAAADAYATSIASRQWVERVSERLVFFCVALRRDLYALLNGLDDGYGVGNFEDEDFCVRAELLGYDLAVAHHVFVYHYGSVTFAANELDHMTWMSHNAFRHKEKLALLSISDPTVGPSSRRRSSRRPPLVSVIVRTKDRPEKLRLALYSLANQTLKDFEVILVNDGGCDVTSIVELLQPHLQLALITHDAPVGRSDALNVGLAACSGLYVSYLDDDDIVYPFHLASLVEAAGRLADRDTFVYSHYNYTFIAGTEREPLVLARLRVLPWVFDRDELLVQNKPALHTWLHSRLVTERIGGFDPSLQLLHDWDLLLRASRVLEPVLHPRETCEYRISLDLSNATSHRGAALAELHEVYSRHPVKSEMVSLKRRAEADAHERQLSLIEATLRRRACLELSAEETLREVIRIQYGVDLPRMALMPTAGNEARSRELARAEPGGVDYT
jgi:GT2 family glycosyltransferase